MNNNQDNYKQWLKELLRDIETSMTDHPTIQEKDVRRALHIQRLKEMIKDSTETK